MKSLMPALFVFLLSIYGVNCDKNGGTPCAACTVLVGLGEQLSQIYNESISDSFSRFCNYLPSEFGAPCKFLIEEFGPGVIESIEANETPDVACHAVGLCKHETPDICHLFPLPKHMVTSTASDMKAKLQSIVKRATKRKSYDLTVVKANGICDNAVFKPFCDIINKFTDGHLPVEDADGDYFSVVETLRGTSWRGKDCNDFDKDVYPGRRPTHGDKVLDSNCNGILGIDPSTGKTYEDLWCNGTSQMGVVLLGDSAGAHFRIPPEYLTSINMNIDSFRDLRFALENEFDWPMLSLTTGHFNTSRWKYSISGPMNSLYDKMRERNRCIHRDYQNIGVNGARAGAMNSTIIKSFARNQKTDYPVLVILELIGNDVCNGHPGTDHMTKPSDFAANYRSIFAYLDTVLPQGSVVFVSGIADGRVLYNTLHNRTHPIGSLRNDVTYSQLYDYLNCLEISPCFGWMNSNESWRNATAERMNELNVALKDVVSSAKYNNYKLYYRTLSTQEMFDSWAKKGGHPWELIEPVDGFHPNQVANSLEANLTWGDFQAHFPGVIPPVNPHNEDIIKKFGDQQGY